MPGFFKKWLSLLPLILVVGCDLKLPMTSQSQGIRSNDQRSGNSTGTVQEVAVSSNTSSGAAVALVSSSSTTTQKITVPTSSAVAGTQISFPPGTLSVDTSVSVSLAAPVASPSNATQLGISDNIAATGTPVIIQSSANVNAASPFTVSLQLPPSSSLDLNSAAPAAGLIVMYQEENAALNETTLGYYTGSQLTVSGSTVQFETTYFGAFQAVYTNAPVAAPAAVRVAAPPVTAVQAAALPAMTVTARTPFVINAGGTMTITGSNFRSTMTLALAGTAVKAMRILSDSQASFAAPANSGFGLVSLMAQQDGASETISVLYTGTGTGNLPVSTLPPSQMCAGQQYYDGNGNLQTGTQNCSGPAACTADGQTACVTSSSFPAAAASGLAAKVLSGSSVAGVAGTATEPSSANVLSGISYGAGGNALSGSLTLPIASKVLTGVSYGTGSSPLSGSLTLPSASNVRVAGGSYGVGGNGSTPLLADCTADGQQGCVSSSLLPAANISGISTWDLRYGQTLAGISGGLKTNCRNTINSSIYNYDGSLTFLPDTAQSSGTALDLWDTTDDYNTATQVVSGWSPSTYCDASTFTDVTTLNGGTSASTCGTSSTCILKDQISNLQITGLLSAGGNTSTSTPATYYWDTAIETCAASTYGGYAAGTWRVPTQKEMLSFYEHGIERITTLAPSGNWASYAIWSATTSSLSTTYAWAAYLNNGDFNIYGKGTSSNYALCVK